MDLSWLAPTGSIRAALISGVLGIPADPRVVEVLGWACYLVPMLALILLAAPPASPGTARCRGSRSSVRALSSWPLPSSLALVSRCHGADVPAHGAA